MEVAPFIAHLQELISEKHLLKHPFYQQWEKGVLSVEAIQRYAEQYYHLEKNFPRFLSAVHTACEDVNIRQEITDNLYDEEHGPNNHRELWTWFGEAIGVRRGAVQNTVALPETVATVETFQRLASTSPLVGAAALAAYESQMPAVSQKKIEGLEKHYGITDERGLAFFKVHSVLDVEHANTWWKMIGSGATAPEIKNEVERALIEARDALWGFLDGICREYLPEAVQY